MATGELLAYHVDFCNTAICEPWMADDVSDAETLMGVELKHAGDQILELFGVETLRLS
jgi:hypothetical protein